MSEYAGCWIAHVNEPWRRTYLPLVQSSFHTTILSEMQHTILKQTFTNATKELIKTCKYSFPIYDGVSVTGFTCEIADRKLIGVVKEKGEAKADYDAAVSQGRTAGLLEQSSVSDVFSTSLGNVGPNQDVHVTITYIGELKNDLDIDGIRLTIPTCIAPRYGDLPAEFQDNHQVSSRGIEISIDVVQPKDKPISGLESPSHPISISLGRLSTDSIDQEPSFSRASATLSDNSGGLGKDFVLLIKAKDTGSPTAILQTHLTLKNHRTLMTSLVPKFSLPSARPEIVFVADRSGSMSGNISMLQQAMKVFLKSLPSGIKFNICSFGSEHSFLWPKSQTYTKESLSKANKHIDTFEANYGGTETLGALEATIKNRHMDIALEVILLTDGDIWGQDTAFESINKAVVESKNQIRLFPLGIGNGVSHSLIEGLARAGNGFAQAVQLNERIDTRVIRMLKAALTPHISNYSLEIKYENDDDFEIIEAVSDGLKIDIIEDTQKKKSSLVKPTISLFNTSVDPDKMDTDEDKSKAMIDLASPKLLQAPYTIPSLFSFSRTTVYIIMSPETVQRNPTSVILLADSEHGPLRLEIPVTILDTPGEAISQLAARRAVQDLEEHRGWVFHATDQKGKKLMDLYPSRASDIVKQEAVRLGTTYKIANKWCSFVAVEPDSKGSKDITYEDTHLKHSVYSEEEMDTGGAAAYYTKSGVAIGGGGGGGGGGPSLALLSNRSAAPGGYARSAVPQSAAYGSHGMYTSTANSAPIFQGSHQQLQQQQSTMSFVTPRSRISASDMFPLPPPPPTPQAAPTLSDALYGSLENSKRKESTINFDYATKAEDEDDLTSPTSPTQHLASLSPAEQVHHLIVLQDFEGFWVLNRDVDTILALKDDGKNGTWKDFHSGTEWITVLVIVFLRVKMAGEKEVWELIVDKALEWLSTRGAEVKEKKLFEEAERLFSQ